MKVIFSFYGAKPSQLKRFFRPETLSLFNEYQKRIGAFCECRAEALEPNFVKTPGSQIWLCDFSKASKTVSSEELSSLLENFQQKGVREWRVVVGPASGLSPEEKARLRADFLWSFGPQTLPHDLAAVVAVEQVYRAFTIIKRLPYHCGH